MFYEYNNGSVTLAKKNSHFLLVPLKGHKLLAIYKTTSASCTWDCKGETASHPSLISELLFNVNRNKTTNE